MPSNVGLAAKVQLVRDAGAGSHPGYALPPRQERARPWLPTTRLGRIACWFSLAFLCWFVVNLLVEVFLPVVPPEGLLAVAAALLRLTAVGAGLVGGVVAAVAILARHERAVLVFLCLLPALLIVTLETAEAVGQWLE